MRRKSEGGEGMRKGKREEGERRRDTEQQRRWKGEEELLKEAAKWQIPALEDSTHLFLAERGELEQADAKSWKMRRVKVKLQRSWQSLQIHPGSPKMILVGVEEFLMNLAEKDLAAARCQKMYCANPTRCSGCWWRETPQESWFESPGSC